MDSLLLKMKRKGNTVRRIPFFFVECLTVLPLRSVMNERQHIGTGMCADDRTEHGDLYM